MASNTIKAAFQKSYDFVICGSGPSGCAVASRLSEDPGTTVLLIEAGKDNRDMEYVRMPGSYPQVMKDESLTDIITPEADSGTDDTKIPRYYKSSTLGGNSLLNTTMCIRGSKQDVDDWGVRGWDGDDLFRYMSKAESLSTKPFFSASKDLHGYNGPVSVEPIELTPISRRLVEAMESKGLRMDPDIFSHGMNPHGCGYVLRFTKNGIRTTGSDYISGKNRRDNVTVVCEACVDKVLMQKQDNGELRAVGARAVLADGTVLEVKATKEVILSAGVFGSPLLLNRSGIGAKDELERHSIATVVDLPGVGKNLVDHPCVSVAYKTDEHGLTFDDELFPDSALERATKLWKEEKKGLLSRVAIGISAYARLDSRLAGSQAWSSAARQRGRDPMGLTRTQPHVELVSSKYWFHFGFKLSPSLGQGLFNFDVMLMCPRSRGDVSLRSADPRALPIVRPGYLTDPLDAEVLAEGCRLSNDIVMNGTGMSGVARGPWTSEDSCVELTTKEDWMAYAKDNTLYSFHACGTCAMGNASDANAVVDEKLCVRGVKGLRVVDASAIPYLNGAHPMMVTYGIGEKAADMIKAAWGLETAA